MKTQTRAQVPTPTTSSNQTVPNRMPTPSKKPVSLVGVVVVALLVFVAFNSWKKAHAVREFNDIPDRTHSQPSYRNDNINEPQLSRPVQRGFDPEAPSTFVQPQATNAQNAPGSASEVSPGAGMYSNDWRAQAQSELADLRRRQASLSEDRRRTSQEIDNLAQQVDRDMKNPDVTRQTLDDDKVTQSMIEQDRERIRSIDRDLGEIETQINGIQDRLAANGGH